MDGIISVMSGKNARENTNNLFDNLNLKYLCSNSNYTTNLWASNMIGQHLVDFENISIGADKKISKTKNQQMMHRLTPDFFTTLKTGRKRNNNIIECIVFKTGRLFGRKKQNYLLTPFKQN